MSKTITSLSNPVIKQIVKIRKDKKYRNKEQKALIVGKKALEDVQKSRTVDILITTKKIIPKHVRAKKIIVVTNRIMKKITNVDSPEDVAAIIDMKEMSSFAQNMKVENFPANPCYVRQADAKISTKGIVFK